MADKAPDDDEPPSDDPEETPSDGTDDADVGTDDEGSEDDAAGDVGATKFCVACGEEISKDADTCPECGVSQHKVPESAGPGRGAHEKYCHQCGEVINRDAEMCPKCGADQTTAGDKDRVTAALLAILLGGLGVHKFYLGDTKIGVIYLCFFWTAIPAVLGLIEGIIYLTEDDAEFQRKHVKD